MRQKFTGYERDVESGLDFAQSRYYNNLHGRFISADSVAGTATSPQTLNRYSYTGNNPLNNIDPSGHIFFSAQFNSSPNEEGGGSWESPDTAWSGMPSGVQGEINRIKDILFDHQCAADAEAYEAGQEQLASADGAAEVSVISSDVSNIGGVGQTQDAGYNQQTVDNRTDEIVAQIYDKMSPSQYDAIANNRESGFSIPFCLCFASQESGFQRVTLANGKTQGIVGPNGDLGLFQIQYPTATDAAKRLNLGSVTKAQVRDNDALNTKLATNQLGYLKGRLGDMRSTLAAYKQGYRGYMRDGATVKSLMYADAILKCTQRMGWK